MSKPSWRNLLAQGVIKRTDSGLWARPSAIRVLQGFNLRDIDAPGYRDDIDSLKAHLSRGGKVPALEVALSADGLGVDLVDGHRRLTSYSELIAEGLKIEWIRIEPFEGNDKERHARILTSQDNRKLLPLELAEGYRRLKTLFGLSNEEVGALVGKTRQHVEQLLLLANAPHAVQQLVRSGEVSATVAIDAVRKDGDGAAEVLGQAKTEASAAGKKRVLPSGLRPWTPPAINSRGITSAVDAVVRSLPESFIADVKCSPVPDTNIKLEIPAALFWELVNQHTSIEALRDKAEKKLSRSSPAGEVKP